MVKPKRSLLAARGRRLGEGPNRRYFIVQNIKDSIEFRDLHQILHPRREVQKLELTALFSSLRKGIDKVAQPSGIYVSHLSKIDKNVLVSLKQQFAHQLAQMSVFLAENNSTCKVCYGNATYFPGSCN